MITVVAFFAFLPLCYTAFFNLIFREALNPVKKTKTTV